LATETYKRDGTLVRRSGEHLIKPGLLPGALGSCLSKALVRRQKDDYGREPLTAEDAEKAASEAEAFVAAIERAIDASA